ncbi:MAG TPA: adenine phosphoribosyltransferase [Bacillota bacterium]
MDLKALIRNVQDFPKPGIGFKDITTLLKNGEALRAAIDGIAEHFSPLKPDLIVGAESRGFILGAPLAYKMGCGFVLIRKPGKLPAETERVTYQLEYGEDALEIHKDAIQPGQRVLVIDDLLATGGTTKAVIELVRRLGGEIIGVGFLIELDFLKGREQLKAYDVYSLIHYDRE